MNAILIHPDYWRNSQLSIARFYGAIDINGTLYLLDGKTDYLVRKDFARFIGNLGFDTVAKAVKRYSDEDREEDGYMVEGFKSKIKRAFQEGYILPADFYTVFFAVKMYEESLTLGDWEAKTKGFVVGEKATFSGLSLVRKEFVEDYYGYAWYCEFVTPEGVTLTKSFSNFDSFDSQFKNEDGTYSFAARIDYINNKRRNVRLGGRVSRAQ